MKNTKVFITLALMVEMAASARILGVFMIDAFSHFNLNHAIMETLATTGHEITIISPFKPKILLANITYIQTRRESPGRDSSWTDIDLKSLSLWEIHEAWRAVLEEDCERFVSLNETKAILAAKEKEYDLMFIGLTCMYECYLPVAQRLNIPVIGTFPFDLRYKQLVMMGNPFHPSVLPNFFSTYTTKMTFVERLMNTIQIIYTDFTFFTLIKPRIEHFYQKYYPNDDPWVEKLSLLFLNNHRSILPLPYVPGIVEIAGVHLKPPQPLPKQMEEFIRGADHGVILFSLGTLTTTKDLNATARKIFRNVFAKIPQRVLWKFGEHVDGITDNVLISDWIPQQDILAQKEVVLFISHVGKSSMIEAVHTATPILAIPMFGDQISNAGHVKGLGVGLVLDIFTLTEAALLGSIQEIIQNKNYKDKIETLSRAFNDRPMSPKETVLYWTEYVLRYNGTNLHTPAFNLPFYHNYLLDVILFVICAIIMTVFALLFVKKTCVRKVFGDIKTKRS